MRSSRRVLCVGLRGGAIYLSIAVALYLYTAFTTQPGNVGLDWLPVWALGMPWDKISPLMLIPGIFVNAGLVFLAGVLVETVRQRISRG